MQKISQLPKSTFVVMEKIIAGTQIALLDHNNNVNRRKFKFSIFPRGPYRTQSKI